MVRAGEPRGSLTNHPMLAGEDELLATPRGIPVATPSKNPLPIQLAAQLSRAANDLCRLVEISGLRFLAGPGDAATPPIVTLGGRVEDDSYLERGVGHVAVQKKLRFEEKNMNI